MWLEERKHAVAVVCWNLLENFVLHHVFKFMNVHSKMCPNISLKSTFISWLFWLLILKEWTEVNLLPWRPAGVSACADMSCDQSVNWNTPFGWYKWCGVDYVDSSSPTKENYQTFYFATMAITSHSHRIFSHNKKTRIFSENQVLTSIMLMFMSINILISDWPIWQKQIC